MPSALALELYFLPAKPEDPNPNALLNNWFYLTIPVSVIIVALFGCHFVRVIVQKRQVKLARNQYFQVREKTAIRNVNNDLVSCGGGEA
jgi:hypothetical protein